MFGFLTVTTDHGMAGLAGMAGMVWLVWQTIMNSISQQFNILYTVNHVMI